MVPKHNPIRRVILKPEKNDILYIISTVNNYNIIDDLTKNVKVNLALLCRICCFKFNVNFLKKNFKKIF